MKHDTQFTMEKAVWDRIRHTSLVEFLPQGFEVYPDVAIKRGKRMLKYRFDQSIKTYKKLGTQTMKNPEVYSVIQPQFLTFFATVLKLQLRPRSLGDIDKAFRFGENRLVFFPTKDFIMGDGDEPYNCIRSTMEKFCEPATQATLLLQSCWNRLDTRTITDDIVRIERKILRAFARFGIEPLAEPVPPAPPAPVDPLVELTAECSTFGQLIQKLNDNPERFIKHLGFSYEDGGLPNNPQIWANSDRGAEFIQSFKSADPMERFGLDEHVLVPEAEQGFQAGQELPPLFTPVDMCQFDLDVNLPGYEDEQEEKQVLQKPRVVLNLVSDDEEDEDSLNSVKREREDEQEEKQVRQKPRVVLNLVSDEEEVVQNNEDSRNTRKRDRDDKVVQSPENFITIPGESAGSTVTFQLMGTFPKSEFTLLQDGDSFRVVKRLCVTQYEPTIEIIYYEQQVKPLHGFSTIRQLTPTEGKIIFQNIQEEFH